MLDTTTKRRIDTARDILVGKVPDPKSQVEQITIALIYKFMDDMDAEAEELGGQRNFFTGGFARYGWTQLMRPGLGGHDILQLYSEGIDRMPENPGIPPLFRDIFKNAYLPYRDPETLKAFLKVIDEFTYDHSERLGDAFEYLLSVLGSQGDAGQFRTPRHIIDFIVGIVDPKKGESILDPACGTAGFLISSYKHILRANTDEKGQSKLTPSERGKLAKNFKGYDISPDMVRLSLVNMYLHGFTDPHIYEYDTLTSEERWNDLADVILANPPFMSPKGGIKPHRRFSIQAKRSEVLFVDYMAEHLTSKGRAGIIVPEGIIFQTQTAYRELRKMLVESALVAVVSLPAGCFNPYSGVKTSILILDKSLARQSDTIAFFKVENDGFGLGAQRRAIEKNDLPQVQVELDVYLQALRGSQPTADLQPTCGLIVPKEKIATDGDYNLSGERYREGVVATAAWPLVPLEAVCEIQRGKFSHRPRNEPRFYGGLYPFIQTGDIVQAKGGRITYTQTLNDEGLSVSKLFQPPVVVITIAANIGDTALLDYPACFPDSVVGLIPKPGMNAHFLELIMRSRKQYLNDIAPQAAQKNINIEILKTIQIPLPPLEIQKDIVAEIEGYQKVINGARAVLDHYRPYIPIHPDWPMVRVESIADVQGGVQKSPNRAPKTNHRPYLTVRNVQRGSLDLSQVERFEVTNDELSRLRLQLGDILVVEGNGSRDQIGRTALFNINGEEWVHQNHVIRVRLNPEKAVPSFVEVFFNSDIGREQMLSKAVTTSGLYMLSVGRVGSLEVPLPSLATQQAIVVEIEAEQALVAANRELITRFEKKIQATLARIWGEGEAAEIDVSSHSNHQDTEASRDSPCKTAPTENGTCGIQQQELWPAQMKTSDCSPQQD